MPLSAPQIAAAVLIPCVALFFNLLLFARLLDPEELATGGTLFAKLSAFLGLCLIEATLCLLSFDISSSPDTTAAAWEAILIALCVHVTLITPLQLFYYEAEDENEGKGRCCSPSACGSAVLQSCAVWALSAIALGVGFHYWSVAYLPLRAFLLPASAFVPASSTLPVAEPSSCIAGARAQGALCPAGGSGAAVEIPINCSFVVFLGSAFTFAGWVFFCVWLGVGLTALPVRLIQTFMFRPRPLSVTRAAAARRALNTKAAELLNLGQGMEAQLASNLDAARSRGDARALLRAHKGDVARLRELVQAAEEDLTSYQLSDPREWARSYNPLYPFAALLGGLASGALSLAWVLHVCVFMLPRPPAHPFLNSLPLVGPLAIVGLSGYLLLAVVAGLGKVGTRMLLLPIHALEAGKTLTNSLLFNVAMLELCALPMMQFVVRAFPAATTATAAEALLGGAFENLGWFRFFYRFPVYQFLNLFFVLVGGVWACLCPTPRAELARATQMLAERKARERQLLARKLERAGGALEGLEITSLHPNT